jgi:hypothetical protein
LTSTLHSKPPSAWILVYFFNLFPFLFNKAQKQAQENVEWVKENATKLIRDIDGPSEFVKTQN